MDVSYALDYPAIPEGREKRIHLLVRIETWPDRARLSNVTMTAFNSYDAAYDFCEPFRIQMAVMRGRR